MQPIGLDGKPWEPGNANKMFKRIRASATADMVARDVKNGIVNSKVYEETKQETADGRLITIGTRILSDKVPLRHTGRESRLLAKSRWTEFCSKPRDESKCNAVSITRDEEIARSQQLTSDKANVVDLQGIEPSWTPDGETKHAEATQTVFDSTTQTATIKRGPGRPRKNPIAE